MSDILKFACSAPNCGRKFKTQNELNTHFNLRHPELTKEKEKKSSIEKIIKQISKPKLNPQEKHHFLQPITKRQSKSRIVTNKVNKEVKEIKENKNKKEVMNEDIDLEDIPFSREQKEKKLLNNLFGQINNLENYLEKDFEFHKEFKLPDVPDYDTMYDSDDEKKEKENLDIKIDKKEKTENTYEITEEMIFKNVKENKGEEIDMDDKYKKIHELNLSNKNITNFKNKKNITFEKLQELYSLNLSYNLISEANDIKYFENLRELYMNNNKLVDISFCEYLPNLIIINFENNSIINITSLNICIKLNVLKLSNNNIKYLNSTLRIFKNLKNLEEITIKQNPFLSELSSYMEYFISNYKNIKKIDEEIITEEKRKAAEEFYKENNPIYKKITERPMSSKSGIKKSEKSRNDYNLFGDDSNKNSEDDLDEIFMAKTQIDFRIKDKMDIDENKIIKNKNKDKKENKDNIKDNSKDNKNIINQEKINNEEDQLKKIINEQKNMINKLKKELEYSSKINLEYELKIDQYNNELNKYNNNDIVNNDDEDEETKKIKEELEMWKKQYFDLLEKNTNEEKNDVKFSKDLFDKKNIKRNDQIKKDIIERPQTAQVRSNLTKDFKKLYEEINVLEGKNVYEQILNEETDEDEEEEKKDENEEEEKEEENEEEKDEEKKEEKKLEEDNNIKEEIEDEIPDDEIEEMFRKSYQDIQKMRKDLQEINNNIDKKERNNKKNNIENILNNDKKGAKLSLKPIIKKKENNKNPIENQIFGRHDKIISGKNKNMKENTKIPASQKYNEMLYKLKK